MSRNIGANHVLELKDEVPRSQRMVQRKSYQCTHASKCHVRCPCAFPHAHKIKCEEECDTYADATCVRNESAMDKRRKSFQERKYNSVDRKKQVFKKRRVNTPKKSFNNLYIKDWDIL